MNALFLFVLAINLYLIIAWKNAKVITKEVEVIREIPVEVEKPRDLDLEREIQRARQYQKDFNELMAYDVHVAYSKKEVD